MSKNCTPLWRKACPQKKLRVREHFLKFWCRKIARRCGEKHVHKKYCGSGSTFWSSDVEKLHAALPKSTFTSQNAKKLTVWEHWSSDVEKLHAAVAKSTFTSQNVKELTVSEHFLKFWCRKIARGCGEKHMLKWTCTKHVSCGQFFEVLMSKIQSGSKLVNQSVRHLVVINQSVNQSIN